MRGTLALLTGLALAASVPLGCGSSGDSSQFGDPGNADGGDGATGSSSGNPPPTLGGLDGSASDDASSTANITSARIDPPDATITVAPPTGATQAYKVFAVLNGKGAEVDITARAVFYVPDNYLVGGFPTNGAPLFTTNATSPRGGKLTVQAQAANSDGTITTVTTSLTVKLNATMPPVNATPALPANPGGLFGGPADPTRAPAINYPNDSVMLPPNLHRIEAHWTPGASNTLFELHFSSTYGDILYYSRCGSAIPGGCGFELDNVGYTYLAESNRGGAPVSLTVRGTDDTGTKVGTSSTFHVSFAETDVLGGLYYWNVTKTQIMRFDFGGTQTAPEVFIAPGDYGLPQPTQQVSECVGCHAISRDGKKIVASLNGQSGGQAVYVNDLSKVLSPPAPARTDTTFLAEKGDTTNRVQFASFDPTGDRFVSVFGDNGAPSDTMLWMNDGTTGARIPAESMTLGFEPDHPDWSPDGTMIAMSHVGTHQTSQRPFNCGIDFITKTGAAWGAPQTIVPIVPGKNRFNPNFVPDSSFVYYSESACNSGNTGDECDGDADPSAKTWAAKAALGGASVHLANADKPGIADGATTDLCDTYPRSAPFKGKQGAGKLFWATIASRRQPGLRSRSSTQQLLWMFAVDPDKIAAGQDGSYTAFYLPFQDLTTSNHIGQWTEQIVSSTPQPPPPAPPPPAPPPAPPPVR